MEEYELRFIETESDAKAISMDIFAKIREKEEKGQKALITQFFNIVNDNITASDVSPASKMMSILILRDVLEDSLNPSTKLSKLFSVLLSHRLLETIADNCQSIDPMKPVQDKGRKKFPGHSEIGNNFIRCQLELLRYMANKFPKNTKSEPTNFTKLYNRLQEKGVVFPKDNQFIVASKNPKDEMPETTRERKVSGAEPQPSSRGNGPSKEKEFEFLCNRIKIFLQTLQEEDEPQELHRQINKMHEIMNKEQGKMTEQHINQLLQGGNNQVITKIFEVKEFMVKEIQLYEAYINRNNNIRAYIDEIKPEGYKIFPREHIPGTTPNPPLDRKDKRNSTKEPNLSSKIRQKEEQSAKSSAFDPNVLNSFGRYFQQVEQRSKSPIAGGFRKINQSLSREKANNATMRSRVSPLNKTNLSKSINSLKGSKINAIFLNPPNTSPPARHYEGHEISENYSVEEALLRLSKHQGHRRFATANFKGKGSIFENQHMQIGFKSEAIYEEISGFRVLLKVELYFGNLCQETILNLKLDFKGDQNILLYANPRQIDRIVSKGQQIKMDLVIIPLKPQFPLLKMNMRYEISGQPNECSLLLPNSALKFTHFMEVSRGEFLSRWSSAELFKTTEFPLSHNLPPDTLSRWIPSLTEETPYSVFAAPGSKKDYDLFTSIVLMQRYEALLKVNIRPNLKVILQLGIEDKNEEALGYFKTFLQHLQQFMKQNK